MIKKLNGKSTMKVWQHSDEFFLIFSTIRPNVFVSGSPLGTTASLSSSSLSVFMALISQLKQLTLDASNTSRSQPCVQALCFICSIQSNTRPPSPSHNLLSPSSIIVCIYRGTLSDGDE
jgi:hypothetical protein